ncbi:hypothetical protein PV327_003757 [Microctonus hyperodae]|uniref:VWFC domain-containing protein n=1 Tax=Microctonus hyperodae TaxID=165561 RepID=A0AA39G5J3_MICHY|nr:hypothetical protein PV327_003757 [Microctonus hyperodae]
MHSTIYTFDVHLIYFEYYAPMTQQNHLKWLVLYKLLRAMGQINIIFGVFFLSLTLASISANRFCDKTKCPGPTSYYKDLGCEPVYKNPNDCCPYKYNCDKVKSRSPNKCYANGHEYNIGEMLREEDSNPCDVQCRCLRLGGRAKFMCAVIDCPFFHVADPNCYLPRKANECCPGQPICLRNPEDRPKCFVDGKIYRDGEEFIPKSEPHKKCICGPGYKGENIAPFCRVPLASSCRYEFRHADDIANNCTPTYYHRQSPQSDCSVGFRCRKYSS